MLFECSCEATAQLVEDAIQKDVALRPRADTPLALLVKNTTVVPMTDLTAKLGEELKAIPVGQLQEQSDNSMHNGFTDQFVDQVSAIVNKRMSTILTVVIPAIRDLSDAVVADLTAAGLKDSTPAVSRYAPCDAINIESFMNDVRRNTGTSYQDPIKYYSEPGRSVEQIIELSKSGSKAFDDALAVSLNRIGSDDIFRIYESLFVDRGKISISNYANFQVWVSDSEKGLDNAIFIYQLASKLGGDAAREYKNGAGFYILQRTASVKADIAAGKVIRNRANRQGAVEVYAETYTSFLQAGGTVEMVIGAAAGKEYYSTKDDILGNSKDVLKTYQVLRASSSLEYRGKVSSVVSASIQRNFFQAFKHERSEAETAYFANKPGDESAVITKFNNEMTYVGYVTQQDIQRRVAEILCRSRFFYVDCLEALQFMDKLSSEGVSAEDALVETTLLEIAKFAVSMIKS